MLLFSKQGGEADPQKGRAGEHLPENQKRTAQHLLLTCRTRGGALRVSCEHQSARLHGEAELSYACAAQERHAWEMEWLTKARMWARHTLLNPCKPESPWVRALSPPGGIWANTDPGRKLKVGFPTF